MIHSSPDHTIPSTGRVTLHVDDVEHGNRGPVLDRVPAFDARLRTQALESAAREPGSAAGRSDRQPLPGPTMDGDIARLGQPVAETARVRVLHTRPSYRTVDGGLFLRPHPQTLVGSASPDAGPTLFAPYLVGPADPAAGPDLGDAA